MSRFPTSAVVAASLVSGYAVARWTGVRPLGAVPLVLGAAVAATEWRRTVGWPTTAGLVGLYVAAFGLSHPLAKEIGAWPSVAVVAAVAAGVSYVVSDRKAMRATVGV